MFERMRFPIWLIFIIFPFSKWRILFHHMKYPPNQRYRYVHFSFSPIWFCVNFHCFLVFQDGGSYGVIWNTPPPPIQRVHMLFCSNLIFIILSFSKMANLTTSYELPLPHLIRDLGMSTCSFCRLILHQFSSFSCFPWWRILWRYMKYPPLPPPPIQGVHVLFCSNLIFIILSFSKMANLTTSYELPLPHLIRDLGMSTCSFCRLILHQFSSFSRFPGWRILDVIWNTPD